MQDKKEPYMTDSEREEMIQHIKFLEDELCHNSNCIELKIRILELKYEIIESDVNYLHCNRG